MRKTILVLATAFLTIISLQAQAEHRSYSSNHHYDDNRHDRYLPNHRNSRFYRQSPRFDIHINSNRYRSNRNWSSNYYNDNRHVSRHQNRRQRQYNRNVFNVSLTTGLLASGLFNSNSGSNYRSNSTTRHYTTINNTSRYYGNNQSTRTNRSNPRMTSLLRDLNGECFERSYDSQGNEHRVQLSPEQCNF